VGGPATRAVVRLRNVFLRLGLCGKQGQFQINSLNPLPVAFPTGFGVFVFNGLPRGFKSSLEPGVKTMNFCQELGDMSAPIFRTAIFQSRFRLCKSLDSLEGNGRYNLTYRAQLLQTITDSFERTVFLPWRRILTGVVRRSFHRDGKRGEIGRVLIVATEHIKNHQTRHENDARFAQRVVGIITQLISIKLEWSGDVMHNDSQNPPPNPTFNLTLFRGYSGSRCRIGQVSLCAIANILRFQSLS